MDDRSSVCIDCIYLGQKECFKTYHSCSDDGRVWIEALGALPGPGSTAQEPTKEPLYATIFRVTFRVIKK